MNKEKIINWVHLFLVVLSTGLIASIDNVITGTNLAVLAALIVIVSERFLKVKIKNRYFTLVPFGVLAAVMIYAYFQ